MHTVYKIHNNSNIFYKLLSVIFRWYMQTKCKHEWRDVPIGIVEHDYGGINRHRCSKCKKVKFEFY